MLKLVLSLFVSYSSSARELYCNVRIKVVLAILIQAVSTVDSSVATFSGLLDAA